MKLTVQTFLTMDGVMQGPGGPTEDTSGGFERGGWLGPFVDEDFGQIVNGWFERVEGFLLGRTTYELFSAYWPQVDERENPVAAKLNALPKFVASSTLENPEWGETTVLSGDLVEEVRQLKDRPGGELQVHGSAQLAAALHEAGLIDEYRLLVFPVTVGHGKRLFTDSARPSGYALESSRVTSAGVVYTELRPVPFAVAGHEVVEGKDTVQDVQR
jgi:dihydrofolate reductase